MWKLQKNWHPSLGAKDTCAHITIKVGIGQGKLCSFDFAGITFFHEKWKISISFRYKPISNNANPHLHSALPSVVYLDRPSWRGDL